MVNQRKVELFFALAFIAVALVKSDEKNLALEDSKEVKRIVKDYLEGKNGEADKQLMTGRFGKRETDEENGAENEEESNGYDEDVEDDISESQGLANGRYGRQLLRGRFGRENNGRQINGQDSSNEDQWYGGRFGREAANQWFNGRFGREMGGRYLPRFSRESYKPHLRGRFGRAAKL